MPVRYDGSTVTVYEMTSNLSCAWIEEELRSSAAAEREWLYPETRVSKSDWTTFGDGYLLMPDPRPVHLGGEIFIGYEGGGSAALIRMVAGPGSLGITRKTKARWRRHYFDSRVNSRGSMARIGEGAAARSIA